MCPGQHGRGQRLSGGQSKSTKNARGAAGQSDCFSQVGRFGAGEQQRCPGERATGPPHEVVLRGKRSFGVDQARQRIV